MLRIAIDTALLAIPNFALSREQAEEEIERVFQFSQSVSGHIAVRTYVSSFAEDVLWACGCGPDAETAAGFLAMMDLTNVYSSKDIVMSYQTLLDRSHRYLDDECVEVDSYQNFNSSPIIPQNLGPLALVDESKRSAINGLFVEPTAKRSLLACAWMGGGLGHSLQLTADIASYHTTETCEIAVQAGVVSGEVELIGGPSALLSRHGSTLLWEVASTAAGLHLAIAARALTLIQEAGGEVRLSGIEVFTVGPNFLASLQRNQSAGSGRFAAITLELCAQLVARRCTRYQRPMGKPAHIIRTTDKAGAMRVHLTDSHEALRLMYWRTPTGIEFANVGPKMELMIDHGDRGEAAASGLQGLGL